MSGQNPYAPPTAELDAGLRLEQPETLPTAGRGARFLNFIIDGIISRIVATVFAGILIRALGPSAAGPALVVAFVLVGFFGYYVIFEAAFGWTFAKLITGTRVIRFDGTKAKVPADPRPDAGALHPVRAVLGAVQRFEAGLARLALEHARRRVRR